MAMMRLYPDFKEFLKLLNSHGVEYLVVGGYAVGKYGYVRATADIDIWLRRDAANAARTVDAVREFGFDVPELTHGLLLRPRGITRMGVPPFRIEMLTDISGVDFDTCYAARDVSEIDGIEVPFISLEHLRINKRASGRSKDLVDLEHLG